MGAPALTLTTTVKTAVSPAATVALEKTTLPVAPTGGDEKVQPTPAVAVAETKVVFAGTASVTVTVWPSLGPLLTKLTVYVMFEPATTGSGESVLVTERSAWVLTMEAAIAVLFPAFGSVVEPAAVAEFVTVAPLGAPALTLTTTVKTAVSPAATVALEKTTLPVAPTGGDEKVQPTPVVTVAETKVVLAGTASVTVTLWESLGPLLAKFIV